MSKSEAERWVNKMPASEARMRANNKYNKKTYFRPCVTIRKEYEEIVRNRAAEKNMTVGGYILSLIKKDLGITE